MTLPLIRKFLILIFSLTFFHLTFATTHSQTETTISLLPAFLKKQVGDIFTLEIKISATEKILGVDIDLNYDPTTLEVQKVTPADFFPNPQVLANQFNQKEGIVNLSISSYPIQQGSTTVATVVFKAIGQTTQSAQIKFAPTTTVATVGEKKVYFKTSPASIEISPKSQILPPTQPPIPPQSYGLSPFPTPTITPLPPKSPIISSLIKTAGILLLLGGITVLLLTVLVK